jgi:prepilin-type processing-associated H-X9-DG protein
MYEYPSQTRIIREIMLPWFGRADDLYGQKQFYRQWHARGGTIVFADGHARFLTSEQEYLETCYSPDGKKTRDNPRGSW